MTNARIERLTREALGPARRSNYSKLDDALLRAVGIVALVVTVVTFASWPRDDRANPADRTAKAAHATASPVVPASHRTAPNTNSVRADYTPIY